MVHIVGTPSRKLLNLLKSLEIEPRILDFPLFAAREDIIILVDPAQLQWVKALQLERKCQLVLVKNQEQINEATFYMLMGKLAA